MRKKLVTLLIVCAFLSIAGITVIFNVRGEVQKEYKGYDIAAVNDFKHTEVLSLEGVEFTYPNSPWLYPTLDDYLGTLVWREFENILNGTHGNIWISLDPVYDEYIDNGPAGFSPDDIWVFGYPWTPTGYPDSGYPGGYYLPPGYRDTVTGADLLELLDAFDNNIHDIVVENFGEYADRAGPFGDYKIQIMVFNLRDEFFYSPITAPSYTAGYFWGAIAGWGVNAFHMDTYQWWRRQGDNPPMIDPLTGYDYTYLSVKANQYEGTFAHEFQHLVNNDVDPDEYSWVDEGSSDLAMYLCGYGFSLDHISDYLLWHWDTPLTIWEGYLADYGASFLWTFYMYEHYGGADFIREFCYEEANGIEGWNNILAAWGIDKTFDEIFQEWCIANYLDDTSFCKGKFGYYALDIPSDDTEGMSIQLSMQMWADAYAGTGFFEWFVDDYPYAGNYILVGRGLPYTASYVRFTDMPTFLEIEFDGDDYCGAAPTSGTHNWFSGGEAWAWYQLSQIIDLTSVSAATLTFSNYFSIEADWDYGYVEVHDLTANTWTTLPGLLTTDYYAHWQNNTAMPDEREPFYYNATGNWNAFTGDSGGIYTETMDLTPFAGHTIELYFVYWTDGYTLASGWYLDDIEIPEIGFYDDCETEGAWTFNGWSLNDEIIYTDFEVSFIQTTTYSSKWHTWTWNFISHMWLNDDTEQGKKYFTCFDGKKWETTIVMVAANQPGYEHTFGTSYSFNAHPRHWRHHWWC
ncbi:MAG: hypothetical protein ACFE9S_01325 [Candidatus Hermodarchaeota archaeon]